MTSTTCQRGHSLENAYVPADGRPRCRQCRAAAATRYRKRTSRAPRCWGCNRRKEACACLTGATRRKRLEKDRAIACLGAELARVKRKLHELAGVLRLDRRARGALERLARSVQVDARRST